MMQDTDWELRYLCLQLLLVLRDRVDRGDESDLFERLEGAKYLAAACLDTSSPSIRKLMLVHRNRLASVISADDIMVLDEQSDCIDRPDVSSAYSMSMVHEDLCMSDHEEDCNSNHIYANNIMDCY